MDLCVLWENWSDVVGWSVVLCGARHATKNSKGGVMERS